MYAISYTCIKFYFCKLIQFSRSCINYIDQFHFFCVWNGVVYYRTYISKESAKTGFLMKREESSLMCMSTQQTIQPQKAWKFFLLLPTTFLLLRALKGSSFPELLWKFRVAINSNKTCRWNDSYNCEQNWAVGPFSGISIRNNL